MTYQNIMTVNPSQENSSKLIMNQAKSRHADLIVLAMTDIKQEKIARRLVNRAPCDILAIKGDLS